MISTTSPDYSLTIYSASSSPYTLKIMTIVALTAVPVVLAYLAWSDDFKSYHNLVVGVSTWFDGELPTYWDELVPELETLDLKGKRVALFGLGDQANYPDNFVDGLGILGEAFEKAGATLVGYTSAQGYTFNHSRALRDDKWCGLVIDMENQPKLTDKRIREWCGQLERELL